MNPADLFSRETNLVRLAPGEVLFQAGEPGDTMFILLEGALEITVDGKVVENSERGAIIGEMALIDKSPRGAAVVARTPTTLARLDASRFQRIISQNPFFAMHVMKVLAERIRHMDELLGQKTIV
jgi:CRP-like cAMP-binding protein